jgi:hypothetical protein
MQLLDYFPQVAVAVVVGGGVATDLQPLSQDRHL